MCTRANQTVNLVSKERLESFLKALDEEDILRFDKKYFNHRLKVQKYVFIANNFGFKTPYTFSLYIHGPYSSSLADDYYAIENYEENTPVELDNSFVKLVKGKSEEWLELAATIILIKNRYDKINRDFLIELVRTAKPFADKNRLKKIIRKLKRYDCLN